MDLPKIEIYSSVECGLTYVHIYRLRKLWPEYRGRLEIVWRALPLEYINKSAVIKPAFDKAPIRLHEPEIPFEPWSRPEWQWPATMWPAFEALACAQAQGHDAAFELSWAMRHGYYTQSRCLSLRHELLEIAAEVAQKGHLDLARFKDDWDSGRYKRGVIREARRGWHELKVDGRSTFILPDGRQVNRIGIGKIEIDTVKREIISYTPFEGDPLQAMREVLDSAIASGREHKAAHSAAPLAP